MSAICLVHNLNGHVVTKSALARIQSRTPARGYCFSTCNGSVGFGFQHISQSADFTITGNPDFQFVHTGKIENPDELIIALGLQPPINDREIIACSIAKWGKDAFSKIKGRLALLGFYSEQLKIIAYRDPLISPPLSYSISATDIIFATDNISHFVGNRIESTIDQLWTTDYFSSGLGQSANRTPFTKVKQVMPGEVLQYQAGSIHRSRQPVTFGLNKIRFSDQRDYSRVLADKLTSSITSSISDQNKTGIMLSSGLDSGFTAVLVNDVTKQSPLQFRSYSWSLPGFGEVDESSYIKSVVDYLGIDAKMVCGLDYFPFKEFEQWPADLSTPQTNPYRRIKNLMYSSASEDHCQTLLNPVFADRIYPWSRYVMQDLFQDKQYAQLASEIKYIVQGGLKNSLRNLQIRQLIKYFLGKSSPLTPPPKWLTRAAKNMFSPRECWPPEQSKHPKPEELQRIFSLGSSGALDYENYYANQFGVETCDPFYNYALCEYLSSIPAYLFHSQDHQKVLVRETLKGRFPEPERVRSRVGILNDFFFYGLNKQKSQVKEYLFSSSRCWPEYVEENDIRAFFDSNNPDPKMAYVVWQCLGFENWRKNLNNL